jgi:hypothetical protein
MKPLLLLLSAFAIILGAAGCTTQTSGTPSHVKYTSYGSKAFPYEVY